MKQKNKKKRAKKEPMTEIAASWGFKFSAQNFLTLRERTILEDKLQGVNWQTQDFFLSAKATCKENEMDKKAEALQSFCKLTVMKAVNNYAAELHKLAEEVKVQLPKTSGIVDSVPGPFMEGGRNYQKN